MTISLDTRPVLFVDIDNCLYSKTTNIHILMKKRIDSYISEQLRIPLAEASALHQKYYKQYGLTLAGLSMNHGIDVLDYNENVDDSLPLDEILSFDTKLRYALESFDRSKVKLWLFTNGYVNHARRVVRLLGVDDLFEGITFCDYASAEMLAKPDSRMFEKAEREAGAQNVDCYFVDDSFANVAAAHARGWSAVHLVERGEQIPPKRAALHQISHITELPWLFPHLLTETPGFEEVTPWASLLQTSTGRAVTQVAV